MKSLYKRSALYYIEQNKPEWQFSYKRGISLIEFVHNSSMRCNKKDRTEVVYPQSGAVLLLSLCPFLPLFVSEKDNKG